MKRVLAAGVVAAPASVLIVADADARIRSRYRVGRGVIARQLIRPAVPSWERHHEHHVPARRYPCPTVHYLGALPRLGAPGYECECECYPSWRRGVNVRVHVAPLRTGRCWVVYPGTSFRSRYFDGAGLVIRHGY